MDRLSVTFAIARGRRLYHGRPFVVFALDLRDPLGLLLTELLHDFGDARAISDLRRRAERRDRAPVVTVPTSMEHLGKIVEWFEKELDLVTTEDGCTLGDAVAVRAFARGAQASSNGVSVFLAATDERSVFRFPLQRRVDQAAPHPIDPLLFGQLEEGAAANTNNDSELAAQTQPPGGAIAPARRGGKAPRSASGFFAGSR